MLERLAQRLGLQTIPVIFFVSAVGAVVFVALAIPFNEPFAEFFGFLTTWISTYLGWFYVLTVTSLLIFLIWIAVSRYGNIRLGSDDERPEYSNATWFAMLFAAGIGTILMFWGVAEPISHFDRPPLEGMEAARGSPGSSP